MMSLVFVGEKTPCKFEPGDKCFKNGQNIEWSHNTE